MDRTTASTLVRSLLLLLLLLRSMSVLLNAVACRHMCTGKPIPGEFQVSAPAGSVLVQE